MSRMIVSLFPLVCICTIEHTKDDSLSGEGKRHVLELLSRYSTVTSRPARCVSRHN